MPVPEKVEAIKSFQEPTTLRQLRRFLGLINYYRRFIPNCSQILIPLTDLLQRQKKKKSNISLWDDTLKTFNQAKETLTNFTKLTYISDDDNSIITLTQTHQEIR